MGVNILDELRDSLTSRETLQCTLIASIHLHTYLSIVCTKQIREETGLKVVVALSISEKTLGTVYLAIGGSVCNRFVVVQHTLYSLIGMNGMLFEFTLKIA